MLVSKSEGKKVPVKVKMSPPCVFKPVSGVTTVRVVVIVTVGAARSSGIVPFSDIRVGCQSPPAGSRSSVQMIVSVVRVAGSTTQLASANLTNEMSSSAGRATPVITSSKVASSNVNVVIAPIASTNLKPQSIL